MNRKVVRHAPAACRRVAERLVELCQDIGLHATLSQSKISASHYVFVGATEGAKEVPTKIRVSDHAPMSGDFHCNVLVDTAGKAPLRTTLAWLAKRYRLDITSKLAHMDAIAAHAQKAAATRRRRKS